MSHSLKSLFCSLLVLGVSGCATGHNFYDEMPQSATQRATELLGHKDDF